MSVFAFTPLRFSVVLMASVGVSLSTTNRPHASNPSLQIEPVAPFRSPEAVGQDNGTLTSNMYLQADYAPLPPTRAADRHGMISLPQGPPQMLHHFYAPPTR